MRWARFRTLCGVFAGVSLTGVLVVASCDSQFHPRIDGCPPNCPPDPPVSATDLIVDLRDSYQRRDYDCFSNLFSTAADSAPYFFFLNEPQGANWDLMEELRIHRRMFRPEDPLLGETPVPQELWLVSIDIQLEPQTDWTERPDLYRSDVNPNGLDPAHWRAADAQYHAYVFFKTQGQTDYQVNGRANFVVVEDLRKQVGQARKFLIYRWEDLGSIHAPAAAVQPVSWGNVKQLYRR